VTDMAVRGSAVVARAAAECLALHDGRQVTVEEFLGYANGLAACLPPTAPVINICENRLHFLVGFVAALQRGVPSLLPPNALPNTLSDIHHAWPGSILLTDRSTVSADVPVMLTDLAQRGEPQNPELSPDTLAAVLFTSGSTGPPVPQHKSWRTLTSGADINRRYYFPVAGGAWSVVATVPAQHMYGFETSVMMALRAPVMASDGRPFYPEDVRAVLEQMPAPRVLVSSPVHLRAMVRSGLQFPAVARVLSATAPLDAQLATEVERVLGTELMEIYGSTEVGSMAWRRPVQQGPWRFFDGMQPRVRQERTWIHAAHLPEAVELADVLEFAADGGFTLAGRIGDMVKIGGKRASLAEVTQRLLEVPGVQDAVAFRPPDESADERIAALVVAKTLDAEAVRAALRQTLDPVFVPRPIHIVASLPRAATGKLTQRAISDVLAQLHAAPST
jgi:acyl-coenzyme A synthetase/AMP-(fatty) acid ligase